MAHMILRMAFFSVNFFGILEAQQNLFDSNKVWGVLSRDFVEVKKNQWRLTRQTSPHHFFSKPPLRFVIVVATQKKSSQNFNL